MNSKNRDDVPVVLIQTADVSCGKIGSKSKQRVWEWTYVLDRDGICRFAAGIVHETPPTVAHAAVTAPNKKIGNTLTRISGISKDGVEVFVSALRFYRRESTTLLSILYAAITAVL